MFKIKVIDKTFKAQVINFEKTFKTPQICVKTEEVNVDKALNTTFSYGAFDEEDNLIGYVLMYPKSDSNIFLSKYFVTNEYRGKGVQYELVNTAIENLKDTQYDTVTAYVSPLNIPSLKSLAKCKFNIIDLISFKYFNTDIERNILLHIIDK